MNAFVSELLNWLGRLVDQGVVSKTLDILANSWTALMSVAKDAIWLITHVPN